MVIERLARFFGRRRPKDPPATPNAAPPPAPTTAAPARSPLPTKALIIWESELRAIAVETSAWTIETGGDLFGRWQSTPIVFLATKAGPKAQRSNAHFRLDVDYLRQLSEPLANQWALRYFGDWHSHHRLGLLEPSSGDRRRIRQLGNRNQFPGMAEIIVTTEGSQQRPIVRLHPWYYDLSVEGEPTAMAVKVLSGCSPIRQALIARGDLPEQTLGTWESMPLERVRIGSDAGPPVLEKAPEVDATTRERALAHLADALTQASGEPVEQHTTPFGHILVAKLEGHHYLAFAIEGTWPMNVLEVHRLNRDDGTTEVISAPDGLIAPNVARMVAAYGAAKPLTGRE
jgi:hypothetical protein